jgi:hypothetical protein
VGSEDPVSDFSRRPILQGKTYSSRLVQPEIVGYKQKDANGEFPAITLPGELRIETEATAPISVTFTVDTKMSTIVDKINLDMVGFAEAEDREGVLLVRTLGNGEGSFIRVRPQLLGFDDTTFAFGLPRYPHPLATVLGADEAASPPRPDLQANPAGTKLLAFGEDRVGSSYNRALQVYGSNLDYLFHQLNKPIATPEIIEVSPGAFWNPRVYLNADNELDQIDLSSLGALDSRYEGRRIWVGNLVNSSTQEEIAEYFSVVDGEDKDLLNQYGKVYISVVSRGLRPGFPPAFADPNTAPGAPLFDTFGVAPDGGNALGVDRTKSTIAITDVLFNSTVLCAGATFISDGVRVGDKAVIAGATVNIPFNHSGEYLVEHVVSEEELVLRGVNPGDRGELNPDTGGSFGTLTVSSTGEFEDGIFLTLVPPLPRFPPANGKLKIILGMETTAGFLLNDSALLARIRSSEEIDDYALLHMKRRLNLDGIYDGGLLGPDGAGSGAFAKVDGRPFTAAAADTFLAGSALVISRSGTGTILAGNVLKADTSDTFTEADAGLVVLLTGASITLDKEPHYIAKVLDEEHVELARYTPTDPADVGDIGTGSVTYEIADNANLDIPAAFQVVSSNGAGVGGGYVYDRRYGASGAGLVPGQSFTHLERVKIRRGGANISTFAVTLPGSGAILDLPFDPEDSYNIQGEESSDTRDSEPRPGSLLRIHNGLYAGLYRVKATFSSTVSTDSVELVQLDGASPTIVDDGTPLFASFYNVSLGSNSPFAGEQGTGSWRASGLRLHQDNEESGAASESPVLNLDWRGLGAGIQMRLNDSNFVGFDKGDGAEGPAIRLYLFSPAKGLEIYPVGADTGSSARRASSGFDVVAHTNHADLNLEGTGYVGFQGFGGRVHQTGKDPGLIVSRHVDPAPVLPNYLGIQAPAAFNVASARNMAGRGSALEVVGSIFQVREFGLGEDWDDGGIFTESAIGAGRSLYPLQGLSGTAVSEPYYGAAPYAGFGAPTSLGYPGQIIPILDADPLISTTFYAPDFTKFNLPHHGYFDAGIPFTTPISRWVGTRIFIDPTTGGSFDGEEFVVVAVTGAGELAVVNNTITPLAPATSEPAEIRYWGQRWHDAYLNIADWTLIGTRFERGSEQLLPVISLGTLTGLQNFRTTAPGYTGAGSGNFIGTENLLSRALYYPNGYGTGVGFPLPLSLMPGVEIAIGSYAGGWQVPNLSGLDVGEPRTPFPNVGIFSSDNEAPSGVGISGNVLDSTHEGNLGTDDFAMEHVTQNSPNGVVVGFSSDYGGSLKVVSHPSNVGSLVDTVRLYMRGTKTFPKAKHALRADGIFWMNGFNHDITFLLIQDDGTIIATSGAIAVDCTDALPEQVTYDFELYDLNNAPYDRLFEETTLLEGVHLAVEVDIAETAGAVPHRLHVLRLELYSLERQARIIGPTDVVGTLRTHGVRHIAPVVGYQTVSPMEVELLNRKEFGRYHDNFRAGGSEQFLEGSGVGLIAAALGPRTVASWFMPVFNHNLFFRKGIHNTAIWFYHPFFDPLYYVVAEPTAGERILPMPTGFVGALDPPHGARLVQLHWGLSFSPAVMRDDSSVPARWSDFQVWRDSPGNTTGAATFTNPATWTSRLGVTLKLWRFNVLDFDEELLAQVGYPGSQSVEHGWAQEIYSREIDLSGVTPPVFGANNSLGDEHFEKGGVDLRNEYNGDVTGPGRLTVDRRHYHYGFSIEFYGGLREKDGTGTLRYIDTGWSTIDILASFSSPWTLKPEGFGQALEVARYDVSPQTLENDSNLGHPPAVKFRGLRLGWVTDRVSGGGWDG